MYALCLVILALVTKGCSSQEDDGPYRGAFIGKLKSYHHQVSGDVYAVDDWTILLVNFNYDGTGDDTFFWAGDSGLPGPQGFIVPDENGKTNVLERYFDAEVRLILPEGKRLSRLKWLCVYDIATQNTFGDVAIPDDFEAPTERTLGPMTGSPAVSSGPVKVLDARTILIPSFRYDGSGGEVYFWAGEGAQPSARGTKVPDEYGYVEPLSPYNGTDVRLTLAGTTTVRDISWLSVWDALAATSLASSSLPNCKQLHRGYQVSWEVHGPQVTIQLAAQIEDNEYMAFGISGSTTGSQMLGADIAVAYYDQKLQRAFATDYNVTDLAPAKACNLISMSFGISGSTTGSQMLGADIAVAYYDQKLQRAFATDYNVTDLAPVSFKNVKVCIYEWMNVYSGARLAELKSRGYVQMFHSREPRLKYFNNLGDAGALTLKCNETARPTSWACYIAAWTLFFHYRSIPSVCADTRLGHLDNNQLFSGSRSDGLTVVTYRQTLKPYDSIDREWQTEGPTYIVWSIGTLDHERGPSFHHIYPKKDVSINVNANPPTNDCYPFTSGKSPTISTWDVPELFDPSLRSFTATLGPGGGRRARLGRDLVWYINGQIAPDLQMRRGLVYNFKVFGGNDPHSARFYHPLMITTEPVGGLERLDEAAARAVRVLAGGAHTRRGRVTPTHAGPLCLATHAASADRRRDDDYASFRAFNRTLSWSCREGAPAVMEVAPNTTWPDVVYYHSFTHAGKFFNEFIKRIQRQRRF
ncbi:unnamed protein product [Plutella xylostella]|uniref:(diamondback moth) hypothetical protein n=1 Tax=Plutella xylostella TaxID=51655 RepID=A0A8S4G4M8_PLUXY|nr:unnamed protein product [Plutella xylostella]